MAEEFKPTTSQPQQLEQFGTHLENVAELVAIYHKSLIAKGIPADLAKDLAKDFNLALWSGISKKE